jgi:hypothetical protein
LCRPWGPHKAPNFLGPHIFCVSLYRQTKSPYNHKINLGQLVLGPHLLCWCGGYKIESSNGMFSPILLFCIPTIQILDYAFN